MNDEINFNLVRYYFFSRFKIRMPKKRRSGKVPVESVLDTAELRLQNTYLNTVIQELQNRCALKDQMILDLTEAISTSSDQVRRAKRRIEALELEAQCVYMTRSA